MGLFKHISAGKWLHGEQTEGAAPAAVTPLNTTRLEAAVIGETTRKQSNPVETVLYDTALHAKAEDREFTLSLMVKQLQNRRYPGVGPANIGDMRHIHFPDLLHRAGLEHFVFDGEGLAALRAYTANPKLAINLDKAVLGGCVIHPDSGFPGIAMSDEIQALDGLLVDHANLEGLIFEGFDMPCTMHLLKLNLENCKFRGFGEKGMRQTGIHFIGSDARGIDLSGAKLANLTCEQSTVDFATLRDVSVIKVHTNQASLQGVSFENGTFGPASQMSNSNLMCADFAGAQLGDLNMSQSNLCGANLQGVDISGVNLDEAQIRAEDLVGAIGPDGPIQNLEQARAFMQQRGMSEPSHAVANQVLNVHLEMQRFHAMKSRGAAHEGKGMDNMDKALVEAYKQMHQNKIRLSHEKLKGVGQQERASVGIEVAKHKVDHSAEYVRHRSTRQSS